MQPLALHCTTSSIRQLHTCRSSAGYAVKSSLLSRPSRPLQEELSTVGCPPWCGLPTLHGLHMGLRWVAGTSAEVQCPQHIRPALQTWTRLPWQGTALPCLESIHLRPGRTSYEVYSECQSKVGLVVFNSQRCKWSAIVSFCLHVDAQAPAQSSQPATAGQDRELKHQRLDPKEIARKRARDVADEAKRAAKAKEAAGMRCISSFFAPSAKRRN